MSAIIINMGGRCYHYAVGGFFAIGWDRLIVPITNGTSRPSASHAGGS